MRLLRKYLYYRAATPEPACVTLLTNLECLRNIRKISRALLSQVDLMTFNDETVTPLSRYTGCQSRSALSLRMFWWSCKLSVFKTQMVRLNGLATSRFVIRKTERSEYAWIPNHRTLRSRTSSTQYLLQRKCIPAVMQINIYFDMDDSYWHVRLIEKLSHLCTFHMLWSRKHFKCMPFGISPAG